MGSLMAGWDSPTLDPKSVQLKRNSSLTKEEIKAYWKSRKEVEQQHLRAISDNLSPYAAIQKSSTYDEESEKKFQRSSSLPLARTKENEADHTSLDKLKINKNGWWTRSNWAFLNEPPIIEGAPNKYKSQFHVADSSSKFNGGQGISTA
ncbi:putative DNA polymerase epsilon catalytic subunit A [Quillaja saponaria]|uniref:DNA polymerase epsilon catalytic subunit A n=1 Tax=Quillaja saponaria TaxID=32244 RepID=A0AAD7LYR2_QUISA|nr:putative DNA polymerase epsilon catalytic subunit A [Quillaja saponaria]